MRLVSLLLLLLSMAAHGQADFRYLVEDWTTDAALYVDHTYDVVIYNFKGSPPRLSFDSYSVLYGCRLNGFTYKSQTCSLDLPPARYNKLLADVRAFPMETLREKRDDPEHRSTGSITIEGKEHEILVPLGEAQRAAFHTLIASFLDEVVPEAKRKFTSRTVEGDLVPARPVTFEMLLKAPKKFDGKRVRLSGFYHHEFEGSNFGPTKDAGYKKSVWLGGDSMFSGSDNVNRPNDAFITVDGTFSAGPGGHMGLWPGSLDRVTRVTKTKN